MPRRQLFALLAHEVASPSPSELRRTPVSPAKALNESARDLFGQRYRTRSTRDATVFIGRPM
jgi:hypothetical protein